MPLDPARTGRRGPRAGSGQVRAHLLDDLAEARRVVDGHVGEDLAVDVDRSLLQAGHELAVGHAEAPGRRVDAGDPELAKDALLGAAVAIGVLPGAHDRFLGDAKDILAAAAEALGKGENFLVAGTRGDTAFDARHGSAPVEVGTRGDQRPANGSICAMWPMFVLSTVTAPRRWRFVLVDFFVRMWRLNAWPRLTVPPGRTRNRFAALFFVFILGMTAPSLLAADRRRRKVPASCRPAAACGDRGLARSHRSSSLRLYFRFGASTMIICRPSSLGMCSTTETSAGSSRIRSRRRMPMSWCVISRPR